MKIVEFRIPIPLKLSDYQRCSIHLLIEASTREMEGGSGLEVFRNEKFKSNEIVGYYTEKRYHLAKNLPGWLQSILGNKLTILTEKSWNMYPKLFTKYYNEVFPTAEFSLQTDNIESLTISENVLNLNLQDLNKRQVMFVDLTKFNKLKNYDPKYDLTKVKVGSFLPLKSDWYKNSESVGIVSYKLLRLNIPYFGMLSSKIESYIVNFFYESLIYYTCMGLSSFDKWDRLTIDTLRVTEIRCYDRLNEAFRTHYSKTVDKNVKLEPLNVEKGSEILIPKEIYTSNVAAVPVVPKEESKDSSLNAKEPDFVVIKRKDLVDREVLSKDEEKDQVKDKVKEEVEEEKDEKPERVAESVGLSSYSTYPLPGPGFSDDKVVVNEPAQDITPTNLELSGPIPMPSFDESEFKDAVENFEDLEDSDEGGVLNKFTSSLKLDQSSSKVVFSKTPSVDQSTQTCQDSDDSPSGPSTNKKLEKKLVSIELTGAKPGVKHTTDQIVSSVVESPTSSPVPSKLEKTDKKDSLSYDIPITFTGYLYKLGRGFSCWTWNLRYIIVCGFNLYYFDHKNDMRPKDTINLKNSRINWTGSHMNRPFVFSITTQDKEIYYWSADEEESVKRWILLLQVLCEESPPYIVKQLAYELTYHQSNSDGVTNSINKL